ncbi:hypothetical protein [uncultured Sphaerochaeta sp.]|uniref:hypothetical protein n=1 Tax=uncultured Sphaerochaeta sp. TaxID=886478 RepID=UPI002AA5F62D|nr:hypothetical protein [uncultured Sphaerochaeta sp.]
MSCNRVAYTVSEILQPPSFSLLPFGSEKGGSKIEGMLLVMGKIGFDGDGTVSDYGFGAKGEASKEVVETEGSPFIPASSDGLGKVFSGKFER